MKKSILIICSSFAIFPAVACAELVTTGSETADQVLQWLTTLVTIASIVANITPTATDNAAVKLLSIVINLAAVNGKNLVEAWKGVDKSAIKSLAPMLVPLIFLAAPTPADAAGARLTCDAPTTRLNGTPLPATEITGFVFYKNGGTLNTEPLPQCDYSIILTVGQCIETSDAFSVAAVATDGLGGTVLGKKSLEKKLTNRECEFAPAPSEPTNVQIIRL